MRAANAAFDAVNAYNRYQSDGGAGSWRFWAGTGMDVAASAVDLRSLSGLRGATVELQGDLGNKVFSYEIRRIGDIPASIIMGTLGRNAAIGGGVAAVDYFLQGLVSSCR